MAYNLIIIQRNRNRLVEIIIIRMSLKLRGYDLNAIDPLRNSYKTIIPSLRSIMFSYNN